MALLNLPSRVLAVLLVVVGVVAASAALPPEPNPIPLRWQLDLDVGPLRVASVETPGQGPMLYYYLTYTVTNNTEQDILLAPSFELSTETGTNVVAGQGVPASVTRELLDRLSNPLLSDQVNMIGVLRRGEAHARDGLVVWPVRDVQADETRVYMAGFSGETARIQLIDRESGNPRDVVLRKTLMAVHEVPGHVDGLGSDPITRSETRWIMR
ncbi:MAG: hypothetical protein NCW75_09970 [Phycisphaera sp.]|nr:MAG: hypothetical protein NCW75_09970 [Phycisphaera sp.]